MGTTKYFSGRSEITRWDCIPNAAFAAAFPGVHGVKFDGFRKLVGKTDNGTLAPITRVINFKSNPSLHKCDARCQNAKGGNCECSCGGANHGAGSAS